MSKPVKELIMADYQKRFAGLDQALLIDIRGIGANESNALRLDLAQKTIRVTVVKNSLARKAFSGTGLEPLTPALEGPGRGPGAGGVGQEGREAAAEGGRARRRAVRG
ncbi:MAG: 50S ribosomal protein L10 [Planctomycetota bacterium]|jgi:large subunit ribosomal protein L10